MDTETMRQKFTHIYEKNYWGGQVSRSGRGSDPDQTTEVRQALIAAIGRLGLRSMVNLGCGDGGWMRTVIPTLDDYIGVDIVEDIADVAADATRYEIPTVDAVLCRDVLCHLLYDDALRLLQNVRASKATYFISTTFPQHSNPPEAPGPMAWFAINLTHAPFNLPEPMEMLVEGCPDHGFEDKVLGIWKVAEM